MIGQWFVFVIKSLGELGFVFGHEKKEREERRYKKEYDKKDN
jgi:hypothetical protein